MWLGEEHSRVNQVHGALTANVEEHAPNNDYVWETPITDLVTLRISFVPVV